MKSAVYMYPDITDLASLINTFIFLLFLTVFSATKRFGDGNPYSGAALGMLIIHPALLNDWTREDAVVNGDIIYWNIYGI